MQLETWLQDPNAIAFHDHIKRGADKDDLEINLTFGRLAEILAEFDDDMDDEPADDVGSFQA